MFVNIVYFDIIGLYNWLGLVLKGNEVGIDFINS